MPSFKRREPASAQTRPTVGLRPAPYPSPVPFFSTGLASLDDVLSGSGLPSSSVFAMCPALDLATLTAQDIKIHRPQRRPVASGSDRTIESLQASEQVALDFLSYSIAQGLVAGHETLVIGKDAKKLIRDRVPGRATSRDYGQRDTLEEDDDSMTIAFRYAHRPKFKTTVDEPEVMEKATETPEGHLFRAPFDMSKRWTEKEIRAAKGRNTGKLCCVDAIDYDQAWEVIEATAERCKQASPRPPALRIHLPCLARREDAENMGLEGRLVLLTRFLARVRRLAKEMSLDEQTPVQTICILTLSPDLLTPSTSSQRTTLHLCRLVDALLLVSDFTHHPHLQKAYLGYGGAVSLVKGPSVGFLLPPGESRSVLRGGTAEAGAENDVGWKRKRRGVVLETLHEDIDAGAKEKETAPAKVRGEDIEEAAMSLSRKDPLGSIEVKAVPRGSSKVKFEGLKSLRERGLRATKTAGPANVQLEKDKEW